MSDNAVPQKDLLGRAFIDEIARDLGLSRPSLLTTKRSDAVEQLIGDLSEGGEPTATVSVRPDIAAIAILVARAIETVPGLVRELRRDAPVVAISTGSSNLVVTTNYVLETCAFGPDTHTVSGVAADRRRDPHERTALLMVRDGTDSKKHSPDVGNDDVASALQLGMPVVGISADAKRHLPRDLLRASQANLVLGRLDADGVALVIEAVTGSRPSTPLDPLLVRTCDTSDLCLAVRATRSADECVTALRDVVSSKKNFVLDGPRLEDLSGYGEAAAWGKSVVADLEAFRRGDLAKWSDCDCRSVLLCGPPGVGKTKFAAALARSAAVPLVCTSTGSWNAANYLSGTLQAMGNAFAEATRLAPCVMLIDELDGISDRSRIGGDYAEYWIQIILRLCELLTAAREVDGLVLVTASNFAEKIDFAVRRSARIDRTIEIAKPGFEDLVAIFRFYLRDDLAGCSLNEAAFAAVGATGADVERWVVEARGAARRRKNPLSLDLLVQTVRQGRTPMSASLRRTVSLHEAGHIVVGAALGNWTTHDVSIDDGGGRVTGTPEIGGTSKEMLLDHIVAILAGRAAEEVFGVATGGAGGSGGDLSRATMLACHIELTLGFGSMGLLCVSLEDGARHPLERFPVLVRPVASTLDRCMERAKEIVVRNKAAVAAIADELQAKIYLNGETVAGILARFEPLNRDTDSHSPPLEIVGDKPDLAVD